jgi:hypothetical protein
MDIRRAVAGVGSIFRESVSGNRVYLGSCASVLDGSVFVTAGHCVDNTDQDTLWVNHFGASAPDCFTQVREVHRIPEADMAVITTGPSAENWASPFQAVQYAADFGDEVYAIGHPDDLSSSIPGQRSLRFFRGIVQRPFLHVFPRRKPYSAFELSFACPPGLSGGPVFLAEAPHVILGVVTGNYDSYTVIDTEQATENACAVQTRRVVTYGVAANIMYAAAKLETLLGRTLPNHLVAAEVG